MELSDASVRVQFTTSYEKYKIADAPLVIPAKLARSGLSEVINHLLDESSDESERQPFDFMVGDRLIRMPLYKFIAVNRLNTEETIPIEYFPGLLSFYNLFLDSLQSVISTFLIFANISYKFIR